MKGEFFVIAPSGEVSRRALTSPPTLADLQAAVGGFIEAVPYFDRFEGAACVAFCNEEGKLDFLPVNVWATRYWANAMGGNPGDVLVGPVCVVCGDAEFLAAFRDGEGE